MQKYRFREYQPKYLKYFKKEKARLQKVLGDQALIEHVGSTAVPGLGGKGLVDIAIAVSKKDLQIAKKKLEKARYVFRETSSAVTILFFRKDYKDKQKRTRRVHIHLTTYASKDWKAMLAFRDYLRTHPKEAKKYTKIKKEAIKIAKGEGEKYRKHKKRFIQDLIKKANNPF